MNTLFIHKDNYDTFQKDDFCIPLLVNFSMGAEYFFKALYKALNSKGLVIVLWNIMKPFDLIDFWLLNPFSIQ